MKIKTLLFGAGAGSKIFRQNEQNNRIFLAYIDNDVKKHNELFDNLLVIPPSKINNYNYDEIIITTQWANDVRNQLVNELNIDNTKVIIPLKSALKKPLPFYDKNTKELGKDIIAFLSNEAIKSNIPLCIDFGTLLGIVRDKDIIAWDDDIDFALPLSYASKIEQWLIQTIPKINYNIKWTIDKQFNVNNKIVSYQIKFQSESFNNFITSICIREDINNNSIHLSSLGQWYAPSIHFSKLETIMWNNTYIQVPFRYIEYLNFIYGNWKKPKKDMTVNDYNNIQVTKYNDIKNANLQIVRILN